MSDGIVRVCNRHPDSELRHIGPDFVCAVCGVCNVDWRVKTMLYADPRTRICPVHGKRLSGAGEILECELYDHQVSTRDSDRPRSPEPLTPRSPKPGDRILPRPKPPQPSTPPAAAATRSTNALSPASHRNPKPTPTAGVTNMPVKTQLQPHGTWQRYYQYAPGEARCQPCKTAVNEYVKANKLKKLGVSGNPPQKPRKPHHKITMVSRALLGDMANLVERGGNRATNRTLVQKKKTGAEKKSGAEKASKIRRLGPKSRPKVIEAVIVDRSSSREDLAAKIRDLRAELVETTQLYVRSLEQELGDLVPGAYLYRAEDVKALPGAHATSLK